MEIQSRVVKYTNPDFFIRKLKRKKTAYMIKKTSESTQIIVGDINYTFVHSQLFPRNELFLFGMVRKDFDKYASKIRQFALPPEHKVSTINVDYNDDEGEITATDLDHAYWRIALLKGFICENTYNKGVNVEGKALRLATLSIQGQPKYFNQMEDGYKVGRIKLDEGCQKKRAMYKFIRFFCFRIMYELSKMLKEDFESWQTDCIYYRNTPENIKLVQDYFKKRNLLFKQLYY